MTLEFAKSQVKYYLSNLRCGPSRDWSVIVGLLHYYEAQVRKLTETLK